LLSGSDVASQRSFFMTAVVLIAVIVDRRAVTFRTLAVAVDIVAAWSVDRLGRSLIDLLDFLRELHAKGVDLFLY
jgi:Resolvase, N terminal domain/Competence protein